MPSSPIVEQVRLANDIVEVIGAYVPLKRSGSGFVALCPFHREKTPSFHVNPQKQIFHCFGCHKGGDVFTFLMEYEHLTFFEALKRLAERARIPLEFEPAAAGSAQLKSLLYEVNEQIARRWHNALINESAGALAREYLAKRGVSEDAVKLFKLGYAPDVWDDTLNWGTSKGYSAELLEKAGLIIKKENGYYDRFRGRLIFPICDEQCRIVAFSGRIIKEDEQSAKYVNSPETPIFTKGRIFYGLDKTKKAILDAGFAIICEGQLDLITCYMAGARNVIAPQGTAFTIDHAHLLKRYVDEAVLCFDSDNAGQEAVVRAFEQLTSVDIAVRVALIPEPHDPDSFIKTSGIDEFKKIIARAPGFFDFYLERLFRTNDPQSDVGKVVILRQYGSILKKTKNAVLIDTYTRKLANRLGVAQEAVLAEIKKIKLPTPALAVEPEPPPQPQEQPLHPDEQWLLKIILHYEDLIDIARSRIDLRWIKNQHARAILERRLALDYQWRDVATFIDDLSDPVLASIITELTINAINIQEPQTLLLDIIRKLRNKYIDSKIEELRRKLQGTDQDAGVQEQILASIQELQKSKRDPI